MYSQHRYQCRYAIILPLCMLVQTCISNIRLLKAYWEKLSECSKISGTQEEEMIINTEWGSFGDKNPKLLPRTVYDNRLNRESWNAGVHIFEKMVSGLYLGELVRNVIIDFVDRRLLFNGNSSKELNQAYFFETSYMSTIESDSTTQLEETQHILEAVLNLPPTTIEDRRVVKKICELVGQRAAQLIAASMSAVLYKRNALEDNVTLSKLVLRPPSIVHSKQGN